jgi:hypothetical protein
MTQIERILTDLFYYVKSGCLLSGIDLISAKQKKSIMIRSICVIRVQEKIQYISWVILFILKAKDDNYKKEIMSANSKVIGKFVFHFY